MSNNDPLVPPDEGVPKLELAPDPLVAGATVELKAELGGALGALGAPGALPPELPAGALSDWASAASGHESAIIVAIQYRLEVMRSSKEKAWG